MGQEEIGGMSLGQFLETFDAGLRKLDRLQEAAKAMAEQVEVTRTGLNGLLRELKRRLEKVSAGIHPARALQGRAPYKPCPNCKQLVGILGNRAFAEHFESKGGILVKCDGSGMPADILDIDGSGGPGPADPIPPAG